MPLWSLTKERKEDLLKQRDAKQQELDDLKKKTSTDLWKADLDKFLEELDVSGRWCLYAVVVDIIVAGGMLLIIVFDRLVFVDRIQ